MSEIALSTGTIDYQDTGGDGPVIVLLHGLLMDASLWDDVIADCRRPPGRDADAAVGRPRHPMNADADLSLRGIARLVGEFIDTARSSRRHPRRQ